MIRARQPIRRRIVATSWQASLAKLKADDRAGTKYPALFGSRPKSLYLHLIGEIHRTYVTLTTVASQQRIENHGTLQTTVRRQRAYTLVHGTHD